MKHFVIAKLAVLTAVGGAMMGSTSQASSSCWPSPGCMEYYEGSRTVDRESIRNRVPIISKTLSKASRKMFRSGTKNTTTSSLGTGMSAGGAAAGNGVWGNVGYTNAESSLVAADWEGDLFNLMVGMDRSLGKDLAVGLSFGYENSDINTTFNRGSNKTDGYTIAPYIAKSFLNDLITLDLNVGVSWLNTDEVAAGRRGDYDTTRYFGTLTASGFHQTPGGVTISGSFGLMLAAEKRDAYYSGGFLTTKDTADLTQFQMEIEASYPMDKFEPFVLLDFKKDLHYDDGTLGVPYEEDQLNLGIGSRIQLTPTLMADVEIFTELVRQDYSENGIMANLRMAF